MDRSTALEMARTKRPGDPEGNPEVALRGGIKNKRAALGVIKGENGTEKAAGKRITRSQSRTKVSTATDVAGAAAEVTAGDTSDAPAKAAATDAGAGAAGNAVAKNKFRPKPGYMKKQRDINHGMRTILVDWLVEVAEEYKLNSHTLYIAVGYIDRFLSEMSVNRGKLQLVGVTSMLLASKYEEIYPPAVDEFVYITDNTYTRDQILKMENLVLKVLQFDMGAVTAYSFAERFLKAAAADDRTRHLTQYLMELTLQDGERYLKYRPSVVAAASVCVTLDTLQLPCWSATLQHYTELQPADILGCVRDVFLTFCSADKVQQQAVREKYGEDKFMHVSRLCPSQHPPDLDNASNA
eukprot:gene10641-2862_t